MIYKLYFNKVWFFIKFLVRSKFIEGVLGDFGFGLVIEGRVLDLDFRIEINLSFISFLIRLDCEIF